MSGQRVTGVVSIDDACLPLAVTASLPAGAATEATLAEVRDAVLGGGSSTVTANQGTAGTAAWKVDGSAATQPVSGPLTDAQLRAVAVPVSGAFYPATQPVSGTVSVNALPAGAAVIGHVVVDSAPTTAVTGTFWPSTQPVSGPLTDTQLRASAVPVSGTFYQSTQPVSIASMPSTPVTGTFYQATQPVSATSLPLPSGASIAAKQPALGTAGNASADVISVQGVASMTALKVDGSAVTQPVSGTFWPSTQPISGTVTANAGANLNTSALALDSTVSTMSGKLPAALDASGYLKTHEQGTVPVTGTFWQSTQPVSAASLPLPSGAATDSAVTTMSAKLPSALDGSGFLKTHEQGTANVSVQNASLAVTGTFWQSTQPVSIASMPSTPVTGTFWQSTQPVSVASMPSTPVTGTFWQGTQPISAASLPLPAGASTEATVAQLAKLTDTQPVSMATVPLPSNAAKETGGNSEQVACLLQEVLRELKTISFLLQDGLNVTHDVDDIRVEMDTPYDQ